ncbi:MAG: GNAT family N-acetyltransferase [Bacillota bacterium]|nr:GNAT family N-acetyltransferase [Bacillota bacterium]
MTLMKLEERHKALFEDMMKDWRDSGTKIYPGAIRKEYEHFSDLIDCLYNGEPEPGKVPSDTYVCMDDERGILVGAVSIRRYLNAPLLFSGGHIGDGVRPSERNKGIATRMIGMALEKCRERGIDRVLITCEKENIASARTIIKNGGVLENEVTEEDGTVIQRYWIENPCG